MQIILLEKIANVGNLGDVVKVKNGFARNYLIPEGKAKRATAENLKLIQAKRAELEAAAGAKLAAAQGLAEKLEGMVVRITQKSGVDGRLFGSVTNADIADAIREARGVKVDKRKVHLEEPIKNIGTYMVVVEVAEGVTSTVKTMVVEQ